MLFPIENPDSWARKYKLPLKKAVCQNCGIEMDVSIPFAIKNYRGFMSKEHACGKDFIASVAVPTGASLENFRKALFG